MPITKKQELSNVPISKLIPYAKNPRKNDAAVQQVAKSLQEFGLVKNSIVVDEDMVLITGHTTTKAMQALGWKNAPEVTQVFGLTAAQKQAYRIADNKLGELAEWDTELLGLELEELRGLDFDIELTGFDDGEFNDMLKELHKGDEVQDAEPQVNRAEELQMEWHTELGQMWQCGEHRVICGDCTDNVVVERLMQGEKADITFTSPPYNANAKTGDGDIFNGKCSKKMYTGVYVDNMSSDEYINFSKYVLEVCFVNTDGFIFWNVSYNAKSRFEYIKQIESRLEYLIEQIVWKKSSAIPIKGSMRRAWEPIYVFSTSKKSLGTENVETNIWEVSNQNTQIDGHKACYPVELPTRGILIVKNSVVVFDPFLGSGTTMIACENLGRKCRGCEIDPGYVAVILQRYKDTFPDKEIKLL